MSPEAAAYIELYCALSDRNGQYTVDPVEHQEWIDRMNAGYYAIPAEERERDGGDWLWAHISAALRAHRTSPTLEESYVE